MAVAASQVQGAYVELAPERSRSRPSSSWGFIEWFVVAQTALPGLLYLPGTQPLRVAIRSGFYGLSLLALLYCLLVSSRTFARRHPARGWLIAVMVWLGLMVFHPTTNTLLAGIAQSGLYLSIMAPVIWAPHFVQDRARLNRLLAILLVCSGVNACVGVLQVYDPDRWMPREFSTVVQSGWGPT
jgi:hypothetical protein